MADTILYFDRSGDFASFLEGEACSEGLCWVRGSIDSVRKDFFLHDASAVVIRSADPSDVVALRGTTARVVWAIPSDGNSRGWEESQETLELALALAGVVLCNEEQASLFEEITQVSVTHGLKLKKALVSVVHAIAIGAGAGIGNMCKVMPLIQKVAKQFDVYVDVICNPSVPTSHKIFTQNEWVGKAYGSMHLGYEKNYDQAFITSSLGDILPPVKADKIYCQRRHYSFWDLCRFMPETLYNFLGAEEFFAGLTVTNSDYYRKFYSISKYSFPDNAVVGLCGTGKGGAWQKRAWPYFEELAAHLQKLGYEVRSYGVENEYIDGTENYTGKTLRESIRLLKECSCVIASDGGLMQLADSMGIPTIAIFGPAGIVKNAPFTEFSRIVKTDSSCSPCLWRAEFKNCDEPECMSRISVDMVIRTFEELRRYVKSVKGESLLCSPPPASLALFEQENVQLDGENEYSLSELGGNETFWDDLLQHQATGWMKLGDFSRVQQVLDLDKSDTCYRLVEYDAQLGQRTNDIARAEHALHVLAEMNPDLFRLRLNIIRFYRKYRMWEKCFDAIASLSPSDEKQKGQLLVEHGITCLESGQLENAASIFEEAKAVCPELSSTIDKKTDTSLCRHASHRRPLDVAQQLGVGVLVERGIYLPESFKNISRIAGLYVYYADEWERFLEDRELLDVVLLDDSVQVKAQTALDGLPVVKCDVQQVSSEQLLRKLCESSPRFDAAHKQCGKTVPAERILILNHHHMHKWKPHGGEFSTLEIIKRLQRLGNEVIVVVPNRKNTETFCEVYDGIPYIIGAHENAVSLLKEAYHSYFPDLVLLHGTSALNVGPFLSGFPVPKALFVRYWDVVSRPPYDSISLEAEDHLPVEYKKLYDNLDSVICNAKHASELVRSRFDAHCITSYVPVAPPSKIPEKPFYQRKYVTLINPRKAGGEKVLQQIAQRLPYVQFRTFGQPSIVMPQNVTVFPYHSGDYSGMYEDTSILLFPFGEIPCGTGRVVLEAYHCGTPVVSLNSGGIGEVVPEEHLVKNNDDYSDWTRIVRALYESEDPDSIIGMMQQAVAPFNAEEQLAIVDTEILRLLEMSEQ